MISITSTGTTIDETTSTGFQYAPSTVIHSTNWSERRLFNLPLTVELDVVEFRPAVVLVVQQEDETKDIGVVLNNCSHIKLEVHDDKYIVTKDNGSPISENHTLTGNVRVQLFTFNDGLLGKLTFKNLVVYPM